jgi:uncharacterized membrane protein
MTNMSVLDPDGKEKSTRRGFPAPSLWSKVDGQLVIRALLVLGVALRLRQLLFDRSLWVDESLLALNLLSRSVPELLRPLSYHQGAPLGFLILEKTVIRFLGTSEMALRLIPFLAGVASLFLFAALARRLLMPAAVPIAVGLFAVSGPLIYYSSEAKQYSTDVAVTLCLFLMASSVLKPRSSALKALPLSLAAGLSIWFSQPAAFVVAAIGVTWFCIAAQARNRSVLIGPVLFGAVASGSFSLSYFVSLRNLVNDQWLMGYWNGAFMPMPPFSLKAAGWAITAWLQMCENPVGLTFVGIATAAAVIGAAEMFRDHWQKLLLLTLPIFLALVASALHRYPFRGRLLLFAAPSVLLVIAGGLDAIRTKSRGVIPGLGVLLIALLFFQPAEAVSHDLRKPRGLEEIRPVLEYMEKHRAKADILYCYYGAEPALKYYSLRGTIQPLPTIIGIESRQDWTMYRKDLDQLRGDLRVWVVFSHVYRDAGVDEERLFLNYLDEVGKKGDAFQAMGASVYLYDLRTRP